MSTENYDKASHFISLFSEHLAELIKVLTQANQLSGNLGLIFDLIKMKNTFEVK